MEKEMLPPPDKNGIIKALPHELSEVNMLRLKKFGAFIILYDFAQDYFVRPRLHKADPQRHRELLGNLISPVKKSYVLDIACGTGGAIPHFDSSNEYIGLDFIIGYAQAGGEKGKKEIFSKIQVHSGKRRRASFKG